MEIRIVDQMAEEGMKLFLYMNTLVHPVTLAIVLELWLFLPAWLWKRMVFHMHLLMQLVSFCYS